MWQYYPTGFRSPLLLDDKGETAPDPELVQFMLKSANHRHSITDWKTRHEFYTIAKRLYGDFGAWLDAQESNTEISETAYDMIVDTINFIQTGKRTISVPTRIAIINTESSNGAYRTDRVGRRTTTLRSHVNFDFTKFIFHWVNQENGFDDMLCITNFIFGSQLRQ